MSNNLTKQQQSFLEFLNSDNVIKVEGGYREQTSQYRKVFTREELFQYFVQEFLN